MDICPQAANTKQNCIDIMIDAISNFINLLCNFPLKEIHKENKSVIGKTPDKKAKQILAAVISPNFRKD